MGACSVMATPVDNAIQLRPGNPSVKGGTYDPQNDCVNFSVYSKSAAYYAEVDQTGKTGVYVCFYDKSGEKYLGCAKLNHPETETADAINEGYWHGSLDKAELQRIGLDKFD